MIKDGDKIFAIYQTDNWHSYNSRVLFVLGASKEDCINKVWEKYGEEQTDHSVLMTEEMRRELLSYGQSSSGTDFEFDIDTFEIGEMYE